MPVFGGKTTRIIILGLIVLGAGSIWGASRFAPKKFSICEVQGNGEISRFVGEKVTIQGIVSAQLEGGIPAGFFLVDRNCPIDDVSSQGIFVEGENFGDFVHLGDELRVKGLVTEIGGETRIMCDQSETEILSLGNDLPPEINLAEEFLLDPDNFQYERWEGMLVSFPEGEFLKGFMDSDLPRVLPIFDLDPTLQMVCLQNQSIILQLSSSKEFMVLENLSSGDLVQNPVGIIRQNTSGYLLDLIAGNDFKVVGRKASLGLMDESISAELLLTETQDIFTSGTPLVITTGTPASTLIPSVTIVPSLTYYPVHLLISEFYPNPTGKEPDGEWVEIYNPKPYSQPLTGIKLGDETSPNGNEGMLRFPDGYFIDSQEVLVVARQAKAFYMEFGFLPDFEMEDTDARILDLLPYSGWGRSGIQFSNNGDEVLLLDPWDGVVDMLVYGNSTAEGFSEPPPAPKEGHSLERYPPENDRDRGGDWREREGGSPGRLDLSPPTQAVLPTLEPSSTFTSSPSPLPSGTASISPTKSATTLWTTTPTPTAEIIPSLSPTLMKTNTVTPAPEPSLPPTISPTPSPPMTGTVEITQIPSTTLSSSLTYTPLTTISLTATETLIPVITTTSTEVVTGTPLPSITPSQPPTVTGTMVSLEDLDILLNEIHADPDLILGDANNDGQIHSDDDEFLEFVNIGENDLDLSGWSISDSLRPRYIFPDETILKAGCAVVVFGGGDPQGDFGGSLIFRAGSLGLNNTGDAISLCDESGEERLFYQFGSEGGENQSLTRSPDIMGALPLVLHGEVDGSNGDLYSPGVMLGGSVFEDCP
jgi:hypothetical protein